MCDVHVCVILNGMDGNGRMEMESYLSEGEVVGFVFRLATDGAPAEYQRSTDG
jgi:hypothetical protein